MSAVTKQKTDPHAAWQQGVPSSIQKMLDERLSPIEGLLKELAQPAKRAGMSPEQFLAGQVGAAGGAVAGMISPVTGQLIPYHQSRQDRLSKGIGWGPMLKSLAEYSVPGVGHETSDAARRKLFGAEAEGGYGMREISYGTKTALAESSGVTGGYTVPPQFSQQLLTLSVEESLVEPRASKMPMTSLTLNVPSLDYTTAQGAGNSPFLAGVIAKWTSEAATRDEAEPTFRQTELKAWELSLYCVASNNLLADNAVGLDSVLTQLFSQAIAWYTDYAYLQGNGVGKPQGVINGPATIAVSRTATNYLVYPDVANIMGRLLPHSWGKAVWIAHQSLLPDMLRMNDQSANTTNIGAGRMLWVDHQQGAAKDYPATFFGLPLYFSEKVPYRGSRGDIGLYDFSKFLLGKRMELEIAVSPHVRFLTNQMVWRVVWRGDGRSWLNNAITLADGTHTVSPFVVLAA